MVDPGDAADFMALKQLVTRRVRVAWSQAKCWGEGESEGGKG